MDVVAAIRSAWIKHAGPRLSEHWFDNGLTFAVEHGELVVRLPGSFLRDRFRKRMHAVLLQALAEADCDFAPSYEATAPAAPSPPAATANDDATSESSGCEQPPAAKPRIHRRGVRRPGTSLSDIVRGKANEMAMAAVDMMLNEFGRWSPLFLYGPPGCGKSMILEGVWRSVRQTTDFRAIRLTSEQFTFDFLEALRGGAGLPSFRRRYRAVDLLILDDVQFLIGKSATRGELLHTLDELQRRGGQMVVTADRPPGELGELGPELAARFASGLTAGVARPDFEMRKRILRRLAPETVLDSATVALLAERIQGDARLLNGAVNRVLAMAKVRNRRLNRSEVEHALHDFFRSTLRPIGLPEIAQATSLVTGVDADRLGSTARRPSVVQPRMLAMFLARKHTHAPLKEISGFFRKRSHSTVVSACEEVERWLKENRAIALPNGDSLPVADAIRQIEAKLRRA